MLFRSRKVLDAQNVAEIVTKHIFENIRDNEAILLRTLTNKLKVFNSDFFSSYISRLFLSLFYSFSLPPRSPFNCRFSFPAAIKSNQLFF